MFINDLFEIFIKYYDDSELSNIQDVNTFLATVFRDKIYINQKQIIVQLCLQLKYFEFCNTDFDYLFEF